MNPKERNWCDNARRFGGSFVSSFAEACLHADDFNLVIVHPALMQLMEKYPRYATERLVALAANRGESQ